MMKNSAQIRNIKIEDFPRDGDLRSQIKFLLQFAILAPSTHNSQPWLFKIEERSCKIYFDPNLKLKEADPLGRDLYISIGACLENIITVAQCFNMQIDVTYHCNKVENLVAEVFFKESNYIKLSEERLKILEAILKRVNVRGLFRARDIDKNLLKKIETNNSSENLQIIFVSDKLTIEKLGLLTMEAIKRVYKRPSFRKEMSKWINSSFSKKLDGLPGYALRMPAFLSIFFPTLVKYLNLGKMLGRLNYKSMTSAPAICVISAKENNPVTWVKVGRLAQRLMLQLSTFGLNTSIFVASIEIDNLYKQVREILKTEFLPQFLFCIGYMDSISQPTPRHSVEYKIFNFKL